MGNTKAATQMETQGKGALKTPTDLSQDGVEEITNELRQLLADVFALYVKTKNFHWPHERPAFSRLPSAFG